MSLALRSLVKRTLALPGVRAPFRALVRDRAIIFMMHRFQDPEQSMPGHDTGQLRAVLSRMRKERMELLSLDELFRRLHAGEPVAGAIAFTIDDGYRDQGMIGGAVFAEFDCPVTTFLCTGFVDGKIWFWWDRIEFVFLSTRKKQLSLEMGGNRLAYAWTSDAERRQAQSEFIERCKEVPDAEKLRGIERLAAAAEVGLPAAAPDQYKPLSWDETRACEKRGMSFGPHTLTHPVLARATDEQSAEEIAGSWRRLGEELAKPVPVFCYPNGRWQDFGAREMDAMEKAGLKGAVVGSMGYVSPEKFKSTADAKFKVQRFGIPDDEITLANFTDGVERFKQLVRGEEA